MRCRRFVLSIALAIAVLPILGSDLGGQSPVQVTVISPVVPSVTFGADSPFVAPGDTEGAIRQGSHEEVSGGAAAFDAATQLGTAEASRLTADEDARAPLQLDPPVIQWNGMGGSNPNDTTGDVGPNHFVQAINSQFQVYDKQGNALGGATPLGQLWNNGDANVDACERNAGDPVVLYDNLADRWLISQFSRFAPFTTQLCIAISVTPDPRITQGYFRYVFDLGELPDYLKIGAWTDGYYFSANGAPGAMVAVFDRANMLNGNPAGAVQFANVADLPANSFNVLMPADLDGSTPPPAGSPGYFYRPVDGDAMGGGGDRIELFTATINWASPATSTLAGPTNIPLLAFDSTLCGFLSFGCVPQPGNSGLLDPVNETGMFRFPYRNYGTREVLAGNFTVDVDGNDRHGIRWFILERTGGGAWGVQNQGTYAPQPTGAPQFVHRFMGSLAMDRFGNLALGYTRSSADHPAAYTGFASAVYTGRLANDPLGLLPEPEFVIQPGTGALGANAADTRWGDYYTMVVDPIDDCTFWYTGDYATTLRQSVIASFRFSDCATDLRITKIASPSHPNAGEEVVYTITVYNDGAIDAQNVVVTDTLPTQVAYLANTDTCTGVAAGATGTLTCTLGVIPAGENRSFEIKVRINAALGGATSITNTATVTGGPGETDPANNTVTLTHLVNELADVSVTKTCKPDTTSAPAGTPAICTILVTNHGPSAARVVTVTDTHVSNGSFTLGPVTTSQGACVVAGNVVTCSLGTIPAGATAKVDVTINSTQGVDVNDVARATSATPDPNTANNEASSGTSFHASADLLISKTGPPSVLVDATFSYTLSVDNLGPSSAANVVVTDILPAGVAFVSAVPSVGSVGVVDGTVTWNVGAVAVADPVRTLQITVHVLPTAGQLLVNSASVSSATADPNGANNVTSFTTLVTGADLWIAKSGDQPAGNPSGALVYRITVYNSQGFVADDTPTSGLGGPNAAQNVRVVDQLPLNNKKLIVQFVTPGCVYNSNTHTVTCTTATLAAGAAVTYEIQVQIKGSVGTITNRATVTSDTVDPNASNNTDTVNNVVHGGTDRK